MKDPLQELSTQIILASLPSKKTSAEGFAQLVEAAIKKIEAGAAVSANSSASWNIFTFAIHKAMQYPDNKNYNALAKLLIQKGLGVNSITNDGKKQTPLHLVVDAGNIEMAQYLKDQQADVTALNDKKKTPAELAEKAGHAEIIAILASPSAFRPRGK